MSKRSYRKIPEPLRHKIDSLPGKPFVIFGLITVSYGEEIGHLGVFADNDTLAGLPLTILPDPRSGTWARRNVDGWEIVRKDLPMENKTFSHESPNFGDWSKGSHEVSFDRDVYQREHFTGYGTTITIRKATPRDDGFVFEIELDRVFDTMPDDERELLFALNIFQEAVGDSRIRATDEPAGSFVRSLHVDWEILPPGDRDELLSHARQRLNPTSEEDAVLVERLEELLKLRPEALVTGVSHFARYIGARINEELVVFDNLRYGNAIYIMFEDWELLSRLSRTDLMKSDLKFERVTHRRGWQRTVRSIVREHR